VIVTHSCFGTTFGKEGKWEDTEKKIVTNRNIYLIKAICRKYCADKQVAWNLNTGGVTMFYFKKDSKAWYFLTILHDNSVKIKEIRMAKILTY
jgi:hypothetical protein